MGNNSMKGIWNKNKKEQDRLNKVKASKKNQLNTTDNIKNNEESSTSSKSVEQS